MHLHAVLRIEMIGSQESCGLQAQGWCGTHPGRVCVYAELARSWIQMTMGEGKLTGRTSIDGAFAAGGLGRGLPR